MMAASACAKRKHPKFFVNSGTGNDANNGLSRATSVATIGRVNNLATAVAAGDIVSVAPGNYTDAGGSFVGIYTDKNGTAAAPITYMCEVPYSANIKSSGVTATNPNRCMWESRGDFVHIKNFDMDFSTAAHNYSVGVEITGTNCLMDMVKLHDWELSLTDWNAHITAYGMMIHPDGFYKNQTSATITGTVISRCILQNYGPVGQRNTLKGHGIYVDPNNTTSANVTNTTIVNCLFMNICGQCVTSYNTITSVRVQNCTFWNCGNYASVTSSDFGEAVNFFNSVGIPAGGAANCFANNNVMSGGGYGIEESGTAASCLHDKNTIWNFQQAALQLVGGTATNTDTTHDPLFVTAGSNFRLQAGSPCKNTGNPSSAPVIDLDGNQRSLTAPSRGCYE